MEKTVEIVGSNFLQEAGTTPFNQNVLQKQFKSFTAKHYFQNFTKIPIN